MHYIVSFNTLNKLTFSLEEVSTIDTYSFNPSHHTYKRIFLNKEKAEEFFKVVKFIMLNANYLSTIAYQGESSYPKQQAFCKVLDNFFKILNTSEDYDKTLEVFKNMWESLGELQLVPIEIVERIIEDFNDQSGYRKDIYWEMTQDIDYLSILKKHREIEEAENRSKRFLYDEIQRS